MSRENNFDLLRLFAALQVVIGHTSTHLNINLYFFDNIISYFPGVAIFFTISGFLIYASLKRNHDLKRYFKNRFLRIYPALWICLVATVILMTCFNAIDLTTFSNSRFWLWIIGQMSLFQYYTPDILRNWGVGTPNGSLWTIPVELEFYFLLPIIVLLIKKIPLNIKLLIFSVISIGVNMYIGRGEDIFTKLINVSILPYLYCFLFGVFLNHNWDRLKVFFENKALYWLLLYFLYATIFGEIFGLYKPSFHPNILGLVSFFILSSFTISLAFTNKTLSKKVLNNNDFSYGIYIYHMLVVNSFLSLGLEESGWYLLAVIGITFIFAWISWNYIEKYFLSLKKGSRPLVA